MKGAARRTGLRKLTLIGAAVSLIVVACGGGGGEKSVTGLVVEAVERDLVEIELLRVRDRAGRIWEFATKGNVGTSAAHLRQHQVLGDGVVVKYKEEDGRLIAIDVHDIPAPGTKRVRESPEALLLTLRPW